MVLSNELITFTIFKSHYSCCKGQENRRGDPAEVRHQPGDTPHNRNTQKPLLYSSAQQTSSNLLLWAWPWAEHQDPPLALGTPSPDTLESADLQTANFTVEK